MKSGKKYILLGLGIGMIIVNIIYYLNPKIKYEELSEEEIIKQAEDLGMVSLKESISLKDDRTEENKKNHGLKEKTIDEQIVKKDEKNVENKEKNTELESIHIEKGDSLYDISDKLEEKNLIEDKKAFEKRAIERKASRKMHYGDYDITLGSDNDTIIDILIKK